MRFDQEIGKMVIDIRKANERDCSFIAKIILMAESTGFEITSYSKMFSLSDDELQPLFTKLLENTTHGHPLTFQSYIIASIDDVPAAALSAYVEKGSSQLMTGALMTAFGKKEVIDAYQFLKQYTAVSIPKKSGTTQIDCVATLPEFRGKGLLKALISEVENTSLRTGINELQIQVWKKNTDAINAYCKLGFQIFETRELASQPGNGKVLMIKSL